MYAATLFIITLFTLGDVKSEFSERCEDAKPTPEFDEELCASMKWYLYSSNIPCKNCLFVHTTTWLKSGLLNVTDTIESDNQTTVLNYMAKKEKQNAVYHLKLKNPKLAIVIDSDCRSEDRSFMVSYDQADNALRVFTNNLDVDESFVNSLNGVKRCNMELYRYIRE